ncbi:MAG: hypothetical protein ACRELA_14635, partial [Candidatus Rokuibacteriota bacterium]
LLARVMPLDLSSAFVPSFAVVQGELLRVRAILIRLDQGELPVFRALVPREQGAFVWEGLVDAGRPLGLIPIGSAARARLTEQAEALKASAVRNVVGGSGGGDPPGGWTRRAPPQLD